MAKKAAVRTRSTASQTEIRDDAEVVPTKKLKPSSLLDTRVVYCGDNLEQPGRRAKAEGRRTKPVRFPIRPSTFHLLPFPLAGSFYYHCDWHASHYVKVMLDQIFENCLCLRFLGCGNKVVRCH
jgi:hypothetical protein